MTIGILAYGSLISNPGEELAAVIRGRVAEVKTPFKVEFSRTSRVRDGAPTLVPVLERGRHVRGVLLVLDERTSEAAARDMLYRRERNRVGTGDTYAGMDATDPDAAVVNRLEAFGGMDVVLHAALRPNIEKPTPERLAELALESVRAPAGLLRRDGIHYLLRAKDDGIRTPLMPEYEREILRRTKTRSLAEAWRRVRMSD